MKNYADGKYINKLEKRLLQVVKKEYEESDGKLYLRIDGTNIGWFGDGQPLIELKLAYGRADGTHPFQNELTLMVSADGNLDFIAGQFFQEINRI